MIEIRGRKLGVEIKIKGAKPFALRCVYALIPLLQANYMISVLNMKCETQPLLVHIATLAFQHLRCLGIY